uniref:SH3 domain-containing protein n=1 Tax=Petromyzon marinus TaxID=7757 RepID=S4RVX5_PETMA
FHMPADSVHVVQAKNAQEMASNLDYKTSPHGYVLPPDCVTSQQARKAYDLQSDNLYKSDMDWMRGVGWVTSGSVDVEKVKRAGSILSERKYRQPAQQQPFTQVEDTPELVKAKSNQQLCSKSPLLSPPQRLSRGNAQIQHDITQVMPLIVVGIAMLSHQKCYQFDYEENKATGYELKADAIPFRAARASSNIVSDRKYKKEYEADKGKHIGAQSLQDDPKMVHSMRVAKMQSQREYKKGYEKGKTSYHTPMDMLQVVEAKKAQAMASNLDYKTRLHSYVLPPDHMTGQHARKAYDLQSDNLYKSDMDWMRGVGWVTSGSVDVEKVKRAGSILSERKYRQPAQQQPFTQVEDTPELVKAKSNQQLCNSEKRLHQYTMDAEPITVTTSTPVTWGDRYYSLTTSKKCYQFDYEENKATGYDLKADAIPFRAARASSNIVSDHKYKKEYEADKGKHIGAQSLQDDPKMVHSMRVAKMQSQREYKKGYEKGKTSYHTPMDMLQVVEAKKAQAMASNVDYKTRLHSYVLPPDYMTGQHARKAYDLQSDSLYKSDLEWIRGCGWIPTESLDVKKVQRAGDILSEKKYRQHPDTVGFTSVTDSPVMQQCKINADQINNVKYKEAFEKAKGHHVGFQSLEDDPKLVHSMRVAKMQSDRAYKKDFEKSKTNYHMPLDMLNLVMAKKCQDMVSDANYIYKEAYRKQKGHHVGFRSLEDDPKLVHSIRVAKMQSDREYKKDFEKSKTNYHMPLDMLNLVMAKKCQDMVSDANSKTNYHMPLDMLNLVMAKKCQDMVSDTLYKADLDWLRGCGWIPVGSLDNVKAQRAGDILSERKYRQHPETVGFTSITNSPFMQQCKLNADQINDVKYKEAFEKEKGHHVGFQSLEDDPKLVHSIRVAKMQSDRAYKKDFEKSKTNYHMPLDMLNLVMAKKCQDMVSDTNYIYKEAYRKGKGHHFGFRSLEDDPKLVHSIRVAKMQSEREYRKDFENIKHSNHIPLDMLNLVMAKKCQYMVSDANYIPYRTYLRHWTCLPHQGPLLHAKHAQDLLSDNLYKEDLLWMRGLGCSVCDTPDILRAKEVYNHRSDIKYQAEAKLGQLKFTVVTDTPGYLTALTSAQQLSDIKYKAQYKAARGVYTPVLDSVDNIRVANAQKLFSNNLYKEAWQRVKAKGFSLPVDTVHLQNARHQQSLYSPRKYRAEYEQMKAHFTQPKLLKEDPRALHALHAGNILSNLLYTAAYNKGKGALHLAPDMMDVVVAKRAQDLASGRGYRSLRRSWICLPDMQQLEHARHAQELYSDVAYKDDLKWSRGIGCFVWDTPSILQAKQSRDQCSDVRYRAQAEAARSAFTPVLDTPGYLQAQTVRGYSDNKYKRHYLSEVRGRPVQGAKRLDIAHAVATARLRNDRWYQQGLKLLPTSYHLPVDTIALVTAKAAHGLTNNMLYRDNYEKGKAAGYRLPHDAVGFRTALHVGLLQNQRLYRVAYENGKANIHLGKDLPEITHVRAVQKAISRLDYRAAYELTRGRPMTLAWTPELLHCRVVGEQLSDVKYKEDLHWMQGTGCYLFNSPAFTLAREAKRYGKGAKVLLGNPKVVLDTPEYLRLQQNKQHTSDLVYRATGNVLKSRYTPVLDTPVLLRAKYAQELQSQSLYTDDAKRNVLHSYKMHADTPALLHAKAASQLINGRRYRAEYEQLKQKFVSRLDSPAILTAKRAHHLASDLRYKEAFEKDKGRYNMREDACELRHHRLVTDRISDVKYKENYVQGGGIWSHLPFLPELIHHKDVTEAISDVRYKEDVGYLRGIGCNMWGNPDMVMAKRNQQLYSAAVYHKDWDLDRGKFSFTADTPVLQTAKMAAVLISQLKYKAKYEKMKSKFTPVLEEPRNLHAKAMQVQQSPWMYKKDFEKMKTKFTLLVDMPSIKQAKAAAKLISDIVYKEKHNKTKHIGFTPVQDSPFLRHVKKADAHTSYWKYRDEYDRKKDACTLPPDAVPLCTAKQAYAISLDVSCTGCHGHIIFKLSSQRWETCDNGNYVPGVLKALLGCGRGPFVMLAALPTGGVHEAEASRPRRRLLRHATHAPTQEGQQPYQPREPSQHYTTGIAHVSHRECGQRGQELRLGLAAVKAAEGAARGPDLTHEHPTHSLSIAPPPLPTTPEVKNSPNLPAREVYTWPLLHEAIKLDHVIPGVMSMHAQTKYKEKFDKEVKGKKPHFKADESTTYKANKQATALASEVKYKEDLKKMHTPGVGLASSLLMQHITSTSKLSSENVYKKEFEKSRGKYLHVVDGPQQVHHREVTDMQSESKYKQDYEKSKGKPMLDFETPTFITARESQLMQRQKDYRRDFEEGMKGRNLNDLETTPAYLCVKHASSILSELTLSSAITTERAARIWALSILSRVSQVSCLIATREYKKDLERVIKGKGMTVQDMNTPDLQRAKNATSILSQTKYKEMAGKELGVYISVVDSPDIVHARHMKDIMSSIKYKADAVREQGHFVSVLDTPQFNTVKENQKNFSEIQYRDPMASGTCATDTPELRHAKQAQHIISTVKYKEHPGKATPVPFTPEVERVRRNQEHVSDIKYKEQLGRGTAVMFTPEMERVRRNQANVSDVRYKEQLGRGTAVMFTPEMERVRRSQANVSDIKYKEQLGRGTAVMFTPEMERVRTNQVNVSDVKYKEAMRKCMAISLTPEMERLHHNRANVSVAHYKDLGRWDQQGRSMCLLDTPEMRRVRQNQRDISMVKYHADFERSKARGFTPVTDDPITERVRKNTQDVSDIAYRGITRRVVQMESTSAEQGGTTARLDLRVWRTNPGSIFDYDPAEDNIQSRSLHVLSVQAKRYGREYPRSLSALSTSTGDEKSEMSGPTRTASFCSNTYSSQPAVQFQVSQQTAFLASAGVNVSASHRSLLSPVSSHLSSTSRTYRAVYEYTAADRDEVSFQDGDVIVNTQQIDEGWMYGTVQRTGISGMLPANYVQAL